MVSMFAGDFAAAWRESDAILARDAPDPNRFWRGEDLRGQRVIVRCLHGLGDAVQMLRFLPLLRARCRHLTLEVAPRLVPLARCFEGADEVITWGENAPAESPAWDVQAEVMELPYLVRVDAEQLPIARKYLRLPEIETIQIAATLPPRTRPRVGLVWSASEWDATRCLPMDCVARLTSLQGFEFWNLQGGAQHECAAGHPALRGVQDAASLGDGVLRLAAVIQQMDLVVTVDTLAAHLAGAMGKPAWVLLQHAADWRWMHGRSDSPWYPSLRLWRQPSDGDWTGMTDRVRAALADEWRAL